jgi:hypothetical protein
VRCPIRIGCPFETGLLIQAEYPVPIQAELPVTAGRAWGRSSFL